MSQPAPRIPPVVDPTPEVAEVFGKVLATPSGEVLNIFRTLAQNPRVLRRFSLLGGGLLTRGLLPDREREVVVLRVGWNCRSVYEFGQHTVIGEQAGLRPDEIAALTRPVDEHPWSDGDRALIALADDLCATDTVSDATWAALAGRWNQAELVELVVLAGFYRMVSGFLNATGVQLDAGIPGWPQA